MIARPFRKLLCLWLAGVLLLAQSAVASYSCPGMADETATAVVQLDDDAANLCVEHCRFGQQSADHAPSPLVAPAILTPLYELAVAPDATPHARPPRALHAPLAAPPPPHTILHCCWRT